jgi:hypothetical protein
MPFNEQAAYRSTAMQSRNISPRGNHPMIAINPAMMMAPSDVCRADSINQSL